jgi:hypothetical protein
LLLLEDSKALADNSRFVLLLGNFCWSWMSIFILDAGTERAEGYGFESAWDSYAYWLQLVDYSVCGQMRSRHLAEPLRDEDCAARSTLRFITM